MFRRFFVVVLLIFLVNSVAFASTDLRIVNHTGKTVTQIYLSPTDAPTEWILQSINFLRDGDSTTIIVNPKQFSPRPRLRYFDIGVNYDDFTQETWLGLDIFNLSEIQLEIGTHKESYRN